MSKQLKEVDPYTVPCRWEYVPAAASKMPKIRCGAGTNEQCVEPFGQYVEPHAIRVRDAQRRGLPTKVRYKPGIKMAEEYPDAIGEVEGLDDRGWLLIKWSDGISGAKPMDMLEAVIDEPQKGGEL